MDNKIFLNVEEVAKELGVSKSYAYKVVKQLNQDLSAPIQFCKFSPVKKCRKVVAE